MPESDRLGRNPEWIDLGLVERKRTLEFAVRMGMRLHLAGSSLSNTEQHLERSGVE
jgi:hypothetical protein